MHFEAENIEKHTATYKKYNWYEYNYAVVLKCSLRDVRGPSFIWKGF